MLNKKRYPKRLQAEASALSSPAVLSNDRFAVRLLEPGDHAEVAKLCRAVYPTSRPWSPSQLKSHADVFPQGQLVAVRRSDEKVVGFSASLIISSRKFHPYSNWGAVTAGGYFTTHDPKIGKTLYGAEVIVAPSERGRGVGGLLYARRRMLVRELGLLRIRAGARLRGFHKYARKMNPALYLENVIRGKIYDPTLSFQLGRGFRALYVIPHYLKRDPESLGYAALIEWSPALSTRKGALHCV